MTKIQHVVSLREKPGKHMLETRPRYDVLLNGEVVTELYFNMRGYRGALPTVRGGWMDIGERGISAWKKEVAWQNKHAKALLSKVAKSDRHISITRPTADNRMLFCVSHNGAGVPRAHFLYRREFVFAMEVFGQEVAPEFFEPFEVSPGQSGAPLALLHPGDEWMQKVFANVESRILDALELTLYQSEVIGKFETDDPEVVLAIGRMKDGQISGLFATRQSFDFAEFALGGHISLGDIESGAPTSVSNEADRSEIMSILPLINLDGAGIEEPGVEKSEEYSPWA